MPLKMGQLHFLLCVKQQLPVELWVVQGFEYLIIPVLCSYWLLVVKCKAASGFIHSLMWFWPEENGNTALTMNLLYCKLMKMILF